MSRGTPELVYPSGDHAPEGGEFIKQPEDLLDEGDEGGLTVHAVVPIGRLFIGAFLESPRASVTAVSPDDEAISARASITTGSPTIDAVAALASITAVVTEERIVVAPAPPTTGTACSSAVAAISTGSTLAARACSIGPAGRAGPAIASVPRTESIATGPAIRRSSIRSPSCSGGRIAGEPVIAIRIVRGSVPAIGIVRVIVPVALRGDRPAQECEYNCRV